MFKKPETPPLTEDALITYMRGQPPDREYTWQDPVHCLVGNYLRDNGSQWGDVSYSDLPHYNEIAETKPWTFGAALARAEALKALPPPNHAMDSGHEIRDAHPWQLTEVPETVLALSPPSTTGT